MLRRYDWPELSIGTVATAAWWVAGIIAAAALIRWIGHRGIARRPTASSALPNPLSGD